MKNISINLYVLIVAFAFIMVFQGSRGLWERDEGRYTDVALYMLHTKDFIIPKLNDDTPHFSKPPLTYWAIAGGISLLGKNEWGARLANSISFALTVFLIFLMAKRIYPKNSFAPPIIYATSIFPFIAANFITTDTILTLWETLAVTGFVYWWNEGDIKTSPMGIIVMWLGFGLAFLTKGPPGILPLIPIIIFVLLSNKKKLSAIFNPLSILFFLIIGFGWYIVVVLKDHRLISYFVVNEFLKRVATGIHHRNPQWYKPFIIYIPILIFGILPWTYSFLKNCKLSKYKIWSKTWWEEQIKKDPYHTFLMLWILVPFSIFFIAKSRLPLYILPLFVPISLFITPYISIDLRSKRTKGYIVLWIVFLFTVKFAMSRFPYKKDSRLMAKEIKNIINPIPKEVAFIDSVPFWGISLYLNCEVEELTTSKNKGQKSSEEYIIKEINEKEPSVLYVIKKKKLNRVLSIFTKYHISLKKEGEYRSWIFFIIKHKIP